MEHDQGSAGGGTQAASFHGRVRQGQKTSGVYIECEIHSPPPFLIHTFSPKDMYYNEVVRTAGEKF